MRSILLTGALACGAACAHTTGAPAAAGDGAGWTVYSDISAWQASDAVPLSQVEDAWTGYSPRSGRNTFFMRNRVAAGVEKNRWRLGLEMRQDAYFTSDRETLDALYLYQQRQKPAPPVSYALQAQYFSWRAQGLRVGRTLDGPRIAGRATTIELSGAVYGKQRLRERSVTGTLTYPQTGTYGFDASHADANSRMTYPFMGAAPSASGASLSVAATVPLADAWTLRAQADDIASRLRWKNLPVNTESLSSNVTSYDEDGYVTYRPLLSGRKRQVDRSFAIPRYTAAALDYRYENWGATVHVARYAGETIPTLSLSHRFGWLTVRGNVETRFDTAGIGLEAGNFRFLLQSDSVNLGEAKAGSLQLHYHHSF
jgi:hypothetical protein